MGSRLATLVHLHAAHVLHRSQLDLSGHEMVRFAGRVDDDVVANLDVFESDGGLASKILRPGRESDGLDFAIHAFTEMLVSVIAVTVPMTCTIPLWA